MVQADEYKLTVINSKIGIRTQVSIFRKWRNDGYVSAALNNCTDFFFLWERERAQQKSYKLQYLKIINKISTPFKEV